MHHFLTKKNGTGHSPFISLFSGGKKRPFARSTQSVLTSILATPLYPINYRPSLDFTAWTNTQSLLECLTFWSLFDYSDQRRPMASPTPLADHSIHHAICLVKSIWSEWSAHHGSSACERSTVIICYTGVSWFFFLNLSNLFWRVNCYPRVG